MEVSVTDDNFDNEVLKSELPVLLDCWAEWCMPCRMVEPIVKEIAEEYEGKLKVGKLNVDENQKIAQKLGITSIPSLLIYKSGELVDTIIGAVPKNVIEEKIKNYI